MNRRTYDLFMVCTTIALCLVIFDALGVIELFYETPNLLEPNFNQLVLPESGRLLR